jgi:hypothetical protein
MKGYVRCNHSEQRVREALLGQLIPTFKMNTAKKAIIDTVKGLNTYIGN